MAERTRTPLQRRIVTWIPFVWLLIFFLYPLLNQASVSLMSGDPEHGYTLTWAFHTYWDAISDYHEQFVRSFVYAGIATILALLVSYPLVYWIAFRAGAQWSQTRHFSIHRDRTMIARGEEIGTA